MVTFSMTIMGPFPVFKVNAFLKSNISYGQSYYSTVIGIPNILNGTMFGDLD